MDVESTIRPAMSKSPGYAMDDDDAETLPQRLERLRVEAGYHSQAALARKMGVNNMTVHRHFSLGVEPREDMYQAYARALGRSAHYIRYGREQETVPPAVESYLAGPKGLDTDPEVAKRLRRIPWSVLAAGTVDEKAVHAIRRIIDENLQARPSSTDGQHGGQVSVRSSRLAHATGARPESRRSRTTA